ncbi:MAG: FAD-dependent oxidoreductase [Gemmatimonadota bacterium]
MPGLTGIIGAGISGLAAARELTDRGFEVRVFEKSRGLGGRAATRRRGRMSFDHGAQYFTVRSRGLARAIEPLLDRGSVALWTSRIVRLNPDGIRQPAPPADRYVGVPGMSMLGRALAGILPVTRNTRISTLRRERDGSWTPVSADGELLDRFESLIVTCPAPQASELLRSASPDLSGVCRSAEMLPCWAAMVAFESPLGLDFDAAFVTDDRLAWASREASKPGRAPEPECWTLHGTPEWSVAQLEENPDRVASALLDRFLERSGAEPQDPVHLEAHRWRYARSSESRSVASAVDADARIAIAGDWTVGNRLEAAWSSGVEAARAIAAFEPSRTPPA